MPRLPGVLSGFTCEHILPDHEITIVYLFSYFSLIKPNMHMYLLEISSSLLDRKICPRIVKYRKKKRRIGFIRHVKHMLDIIFPIQKIPEKIFM